MHVDAAALTAAGGVLARQQAHLEATRRYVDAVCDRPGALVGVLAVFRGTYADALAASTRGLADAARLARGLERAVCAFRDDVLEVDTGTAARLARTERMLHGPSAGAGPTPVGAPAEPVGGDGAGSVAGRHATSSVVASAGPGTAPLGDARPSSGLARVLSTRAVDEATGLAAASGTEAGSSPTDGLGGDGAERGPSSARAGVEAVRSLHEQVGDLQDTVRGVGASLGETGHGLADLDTYADFTAGTTDSAADLAARLGASA